VRSPLLLIVVACGGTAPAPTPKPPQPEPPPVVAEAATRRELAVPTGPSSLVVAGNHLVWTDIAGSIWTMPADGGTPRELTDQHTHAFAFHAVLAGNRVLVTTKRDLYAVTLPDTVRAIDAKLAEQPEEAVADDQAVYVTLFKRNEIQRVELDGHTRTLTSFPRGVLALHGDTLFIASYSAGVLEAMPKTGGTAKKIAGGFVRPTAIAADDTYAFVYTEKDRMLHRVVLATGEVTTLATDLVNADDLVLDGDSVYTVSWDHPARLLRIPKSGGPPRVLANDLQTPRSLVIAGAYVWLVDRDRNAILRIPK